MTPANVIPKSRPSDERIPLEASIILSSCHSFIWLKHSDEKISLEVWTSNLFLSFVACQLHAKNHDQPTKLQTMKQNVFRIGESSWILKI